jgi:formylglycine-generating enzyme required for sulfatase activity
MVGATTLKLRGDKPSGLSFLLAALVFATVGLKSQTTQPSSLAPTGMVLVPAGEFWMGRTRLWLMDEIGWQLRDRADDRPVHRVSLNAFAIDAHEVTNAEYASMATAAKVPYHWGGPRPPAGKEQLPVYNVSWFDASKFCASQGKRLPTEAEWEKAARGGVADTDYPWGDEYFGEAPAPKAPPKRYAQSNSSTGPVAVGSFAPNGYGIHDMSGNLWEWVSDWYDLYYYSTSVVENPKGPSEGLYKVIRGGSWADSETRYGTVYYRNFTAPTTAQPTIGFRCAKTL